MNRHATAITLPAITTLAAVGALSCGSLMPRAGAQILNGGFESGFVPAFGSGFTPAPWTSTAPGNIVVAFDTWASSGGNGLPPSVAGLFTGVVAAQGQRWAGGFNFENMYQQMAFTLTPGQQYTVSALVHAPNINNGYVSGGWRFGLGASGSSTPLIVATFAPTVTWNQGWVMQSATFTAPGNAASLQYFFPQVYKTGLTSTYMAIDDIRITPVPGPGPLALLAAGGPLCVRRRRG